MLRRDLREIYQSFSPDVSCKEALAEELLEARPKAEEIKGKKWKPRGQTRVRLTAAVLVLLVLGGGLYAAYRFGVLQQAYHTVMQYVEQYRQEKNPPESQAPESLPAASNQTDPGPEQTMKEAYQQIVSKYRTAIRENWDATKCMEEDISLLVTFLTEADQLSAARMDLDGDGVPELLITDGNVIYDLYAYTQGRTVHVLSGAERNSYSLTDDKILVNVGSNGAASTIYTFYRYSAGNLIVDQRLIFDADVDPENPWFRGYGEVENAQPISEDEAQAMIDSYPKASIIGVPITEYA